ncbi:MAPEG family protein [Parasphingorhabdus sp.]|uniref:MAPEG family protein n=1 Tax=Parasphingorhabdus sp. TaxID=2709688 RepID=UPI0007F400BE|nr:hypothetical protein A8B75_18960 [Sphingomonadales bacterium EhC05]
MTVPVTAMTAAILTLLFIFLSFQVVKQRVRTETSFGAGNDEHMDMVRGCQSNLIEYTPITLIMLALLELSSAHHLSLMVLAVIFMIARFLHPFGMHQHQAGKGLRLRQIAMLMTWLVMAALALWTIYICVTVNLLS